MSSMRDQGVIRMRDRHPDLLAELEAAILGCDDVCAAEVGYELGASRRAVALRAWRYLEVFLQPEDLYSGPGLLEDRRCAAATSAGQQMMTNSRCPPAVFRLALSCVDEELVQFAIESHVLPLREIPLPLARRFAPEALEYRLARLPQLVADFAACLIADFAGTVGELVAASQHLAAVPELVADLVAA